jgi:hypothetical protein
MASHGHKTSADDQCRETIETHELTHGIEKNHLRPSFLIWTVLIHG